MTNTEQIYKGINSWINHKVDELIGENIWMALASGTIKRVANEFVDSMIPSNVLELMLSNHGVIDADIFAQEMIGALNNVPDMTQDLGAGIALHLSKGTVSIELPSNSIVKALLNGDNVINFREPDIRELAQYINQAKNE